VCGIGGACGSGTDRRGTSACASTRAVVGPGPRSEPVSCGAGAATRGIARPSVGPAVFTVGASAGRGTAAEPERGVMGAASSLSSAGGDGGGAAVGIGGGEVVATKEGSTSRARALLPSCDGVVVP